MKSKIQNVFTVFHAQDVPPEPEIKVIASIGGEEAIRPKSSEFVMHVCFELKGRSFNPEQANPILRRFRRQLENFKIEEGTMKIWITRVDEFEAEQVHADLARCSQQILWRAHDPKGFSLDAIKPRLLQDMLTQKLKDEETDISIKMTDALYEGSHKSAPWPKNEFGKEQSFF